MPRAVVLMLSMSVVIGSVVAAQAQGPQAPATGEGLRAARPSGFSFLGPESRLDTFPQWILLRTPAVQAELKVTPDQAGKVQQGRTAFSKDLARLKQEAKDALDQYRKGRDALGLPYERDVEIATSKQYGYAQSAFIEQGYTAGLNTLDRRQRARLEQIWLQAEGPVALTRPEIQDRLNMGPDQAELIAAILAEGRQEMGRVSSPPLNLPDDFRKLDPAKRKAVLETGKVKSALGKSRDQALAVRKWVEQRIAKVLTKRQLENFRKLQGEPFDFAKMSATSTSVTADPR